MAAKSWRDVYDVHPAAEMFPMMSTNELRDLGEDIKKNGLRTPIALWAPTNKSRRDDYLVLDGRNRLDALEEIGIHTIGTTTTGATTMMIPRLGADLPDGMPMPSIVYFVGEVETRDMGSAGLGESQLEPATDPYDFVLSANVHRRHLDATQRRELIQKVLQAHPEKSNRQIGKLTTVDHKTVGSKRTELERRGEIPHVDERVDTKGRKQPSRKPLSRNRTNLAVVPKPGDPAPSTGPSKANREKGRHHTPADIGPIKAPPTINELADGALHSLGEIKRGIVDLHLHLTSANLKRLGAIQTLLNELFVIDLEVA